MCSNFYLGSPYINGCLHYVDLLLCLCIKIHHDEQKHNNAFLECSQTRARRKSHAQLRLFPDNFMISNCNFVFFVLLSYIPNILIKTALSLHIFHEIYSYNTSLPVCIQKIKYSQLYCLSDIIHQMSTKLLVAKQF